MLFRFLIIVSLLLASVEGAPINICRHDPWTKPTIPAGFGTRVVSRTRICIIGQDNCFLHKQCKGPKDYGLDGILPPMIPWNKDIIYYVVFTISIFLLGAFSRIIYNTICRYLIEDTFRRNDEDKETRDKPIVDGILPPKITWKKVITYIAFFTIITFVPGAFIDATCDAICRYLIEDKFRRNDEDKETRDKHIEQQKDGKHIPPPQPVSRIRPQVSDICALCKICLHQNLPLSISRSRREPKMNKRSKQRRLYLSKTRQIPGLVFVLPH